MRRISPAMIVALIALVFSLAGTSYAVTKLPSNSVGTAQIKNSAVTSKKIKDGSVAPIDLTAAAKATLQGAKGDVGATGGPGVNKIASLSENPTDVVLSSGSQTVMTTTITTTVTTTLAIHGTLNIYNSAGTAAARVICGAIVDGTQAGSAGSAGQVPGTFGEIEMPVLATSASLAAGAHTVSISCSSNQQGAGTAPEIRFDNGNLLAVAYLQ
ncbi:MAG: hypothetical protein WCO40_11055 [Thermoleophilia bacterium]